MLYFRIIIDLEQTFIFNWFHNYVIVSKFRYYFNFIIRVLAMYQFNFIIIN